MPVWFKEKSLGEYVQITDDAVAAARHNPMLDEIRDPEELATLNAGTGGGYSAYEIAVQQGFKGDEDAWLLSLHGANGICGAVPDYDKAYTVTATKTSNTTGNNWQTYNCTMPDDGYILLTAITQNSINAANIGVSLKDGQIIYISGVSTAYSGSNGHYHYIPAKKQDIIQIRVYPAATVPTLYFIPLYKPDFAEEHIVGYLGVKAVYEKQLTGTFETGDYKLFADVSSLGIDEVLSISGSLYKAGRGVQFPTPFSSDSSHCYFVYDENSKQIQVVSSSGWSGFSARVTLRYTKQ